MNGGKGYISVREASCRWGVSERRVNQYCARDGAPAYPGLGAHGRSRRTQKKPLTRASRDGTSSLSGQAPDGQPSAF